MSRGASVTPGDGRGRGEEEGRRLGKRRSRAPRPSPSELEPAERHERAREDALRLLAHRERSRKELRSKLRGKGYDADTIEAVLDRLAAAGLQSDERFASLFAAEAQRGRGLASSAVQGELRRRGIAKELAAAAATEPPEDEEERARKLALSKAARMVSATPEVRRRRVAALLARRGYAPELCYRMAAEAAGSSVEGADRVP